MADDRSAAPKWRIFVGTYTRKGSEGIYLFEVDRITGEMTAKDLAGEAKNPSFVCVHPTGEFLYAVGEMSDFQGRSSGAVSAFRIDRGNGKLTLLNQQPSGGAGPCHVSVDPSGRILLVANYGGGSVSSFPIQPDGRLGEKSGFSQHEGSGPNRERQKEPHAHSIFVDPSGRFALSADLGIDQVVVYRLNAETGALENTGKAGRLAPGAGPRHLAFGRGGDRVYVINELDSTATVFSFDPKSGEMEVTQVLSTLPEGAAKDKNAPAEILLHPSGRFLYGSNRGHESIAIFRVEADGSLAAAGHVSSGGKNPRNFGIDPEGRLLIVAHQDSDDLVVFRIDSGTGMLTPTGETATVSMPVCVRFA